MKIKQRTQRARSQDFEGEGPGSESLRQKGVGGVIRG